MYNTKLTVDSSVRARKNRKHYLFITRRIFGVRFTPVSLTALLRNVKRLAQHEIKLK